MKNSRLISDLHPYVKGLCIKHIELCKQNGIDLLVTSTLRDAEYQRYLYEEVPGSTTTPLIGPHGFRLAYDVVPLVNGDADWDSPQWNKIGRLGKCIGLEWAGDWKSFIEKAHFQYTQGLSGADLRAGKRLNFLWRIKFLKVRDLILCPKTYSLLQKASLKAQLH